MAPTRRQDVKSVLFLPLAWSQLEVHSATQGDRLAKIVSEAFTRWLPPTGTCAAGGVQA